MPVIPKYRSTVQPQAIPSSPRISIDAPIAAFGGTQGRDLQQAGDTLQRSSMVLSHVLGQMQADDNEQAARRADIEFTKRLVFLQHNPDPSQGALGFFNLKGGDVYAKDAGGTSAYDRHLADIEASRDQILGGLTNPGAKNAFYRISSTRINGAIDSAAQHAGRERSADIISTAQARIEMQAQAGATDPYNPASLRQSLSVNHLEVASIARQKGLQATDEKGQTIYGPDGMPVLGDAAKMLKQQADDKTIHDFAMAILGDQKTGRGGAQGALAFVEQNKDKMSAGMYSQLSLKLEPAAEADEARTMALAVSGAGAGKVAWTVSPTADKNSIGNLRPGGNQGGYRAYARPEDGVADAADLLRRGYRGRTLLQIGEKWAPKGDGNNDPVAWANAVSKASGLPVDQAPNLDDPATVAKLLKGIATIEKSPQGRAIFTDDIIGSGVNRAFSGRPLTPAQQAVASYQERADAIKAHFQQAYANNPAKANRMTEAALHELDALTAQQVKAQQMSTTSARNTLLTRVFDPKSGYTSMDAVYKDQEARTLLEKWAEGDPEAVVSARRAVEQNVAGKDPVQNQETDNLFNLLHGMSTNNPAAFSSLKLDQYIGKLPRNQFQALIGKQIEATSLQAQQKAESVKRVMSSIPSGEYKAAGYNQNADNQSDVDKYNILTGAVSHLVNAFYQEKGRAPSEQEAQQMVRQKMMAGSVPRPFWSGEKMTLAEAEARNKGEEWRPADVSETRKNYLKAQWDRRVAMTGAPALFDDRALKAITTYIAKPETVPPEERNAIITSYRVYNGRRDATPSNEEIALAYTIKRVQEREKKSEVYEYDPSQERMD